MPRNRRSQLKKQLKPNENRRNIPDLRVKYGKTQPKGAKQPHGDSKESDVGQTLSVMCGKEKNGRGCQKDGETWCRSLGPLMRLEEAIVVRLQRPK